MFPIQIQDSFAENPAVTGFTLNHLMEGPLFASKDAGFTTNHCGAHVSVAVGTLVLSASSVLIFLSLGPLDTVEQLLTHDIMVKHQAAMINQ